LGRKIHLGALWLAACVLLASACAHAAALTGTPPYTRFTPDIEVFPQNFDVAEDGTSIVYLANAGGVLTFDGARWRLLRLPNHELARSLAYDGHDRIYVGGYNELGYVERDARGQPVFHDLTARFKAFLKGESFEDVWRICITPQGVFFRALHHLFAYDPVTGRTRAWRNPDRFGAMSVYRGEIVVQFRGEGLKRLHAGRWQALPGAAVAGQIYYMADLPNDGLLMLGPDGAWRVYRHGTLSDYPMPAGVPSSSHFSTARALPDGTLVLTATDGYLYLIAPGGQSMHRLRLDSGYLSGVIQANDGGLLVSADSGIYHIAWPSSWTTIGPETGLSGPYQLSHWRGRWQVLTSAGVFESASSPDTAEGLHFTPTDWTVNEAWDLLPLDGHDALLAESYSVKLIHDGVARPITHAHLYPRLLVRSRLDPELVYVGTEQGLASLRKGASGWRLELDQEQMGSPNISSLVEIAPHRLWAGSERGGLHLLELSPDGTRILHDQPMGAAQGLDYGDRVQGVSVVQLADGSVIASTAAGEFRWRNGRFERDGLGGLDRLRERGEWVSLQAIGDTLWAYSYNHIYRRDGRSGSWQAEPIGRLLQGAIQNLYTDADGSVAFVATGSILCYHPVTLPKSAPPQVMLRSILLTQANGRHRYLPLDKPLELPEGEQTLTFAFALPDYGARDGVRFKAALTGFENMPGEWTDSKEYTYSHLRPVSYSFQLLGLDAQGHVTQAPPFHLRVIPPWYARTWITVVWGGLATLCLLALIAWYIRRRTRWLQLDKLRLESMVAERTLDLERANRQLEAMAHLDSLTGLPNRRRLDGYLEIVWPNAMERLRPMSILAIDADHFKSYNDQHGHLAGDHLLKQMAAVLSQCLRRTEDFIARYGGEEFLVILPGADSNTAYAIAESMRVRVAQAALGVTISVGVASCVAGAGLAASTLINAADAALYRAKAAGRNRVATAQAVELVEEP